MQKRPLPTLFLTALSTLLAMPGATQSNSGIQTPVLNEAIPASTNSIIELFNPGSTPAPLAGLYLTDSMTSAAPWLIPSNYGPLGPGKRRIIYANGPYNTPVLNKPNFTLEPGETLYLLNTDGTVLDSLTTATLPYGASAGRLPDGGQKVTLFRRSPNKSNAQPGYGTVLYSAEDSTLLSGKLSLSAPLRMGHTVSAHITSFPPFSTTFVMMAAPSAPAEIPFLGSTLLFDMSAQFFGSATTDDLGQAKLDFFTSPDPTMIGMEAYLQAFGANTQSLALEGSNALRTKIEPANTIAFSQDLIDEALNISLISLAEPESVTVELTAKRVACIHYLALVGDHLEKTTGAVTPALNRAVEHLRRVGTTNGTPALAGGHSAHADAPLPMAIGVARRNPAMWSQFTKKEKDHLDLIMEHVLYTAALFCHVNTPCGRSTSEVMMNGHGTGSLPNQSGPMHSYLIGAYMYWGGVTPMNTILANYDNLDFIQRLQTAGLSVQENYYDDPEIYDIRAMLEGNPVGCGGQSSDPLGIRVGISLFNTRSLTGSIPGDEISQTNRPSLVTTPGNIVSRFGAEFFAGAQPNSMIGVDSGSACPTMLLGLVDASGAQRARLPYEGTGKGMPYEFTSRSLSGVPSRSSWTYSITGWGQFATMYSTIALAGYIDPTNPRHADATKQMQRSTEIVRFVGVEKWRSSIGSGSSTCSENHGDAFSDWHGHHWAQDLIENLVFSGATLPTNPNVP